MRDFGPEVMQKRSYILDIIKKVFVAYGFQALETPAMENIEVLTGKYGDEGDQLLYRILNSGDFLHKKGEPFISSEDLGKGEKHLSSLLAEKGLRYDLTVPFARYVASNYNELPIPFKRFQIQPVWRADRPQKGRYREFYQCDADFVGSKSLLCEAEILSMIQEVFSNLGIEDYFIHLNNRKLLDEIAAKLKITNTIQFFTILDKLDKIGNEDVLKEFESLQYDQSQIKFISEIINLKGSNTSKLQELKNLLSEDSIGLSELQNVLEIHSSLGSNSDFVNLNPTLARGLGYYTGTILEVKINNVQIGSVSGGGRYDNLTEMFGLPDVSGVGFSFGVDRIYDVLEELELFPDTISQTSTVLITYFDEKGFNKGLELLASLRKAKISVELYPDIAKMKKQLQFADKKNIPHVVMIGDDELKNDNFLLKDMLNGDQSNVSKMELINKLK